MDSIAGQVARWGTHPSWSRLLGNPRIYLDIEDRLTELLEAPDTLVLPTITHDTPETSRAGSSWNRRQCGVHDASRAWFISSGGTCLSAHAEFVCDMNPPEE